MYYAPQPTAGLAARRSALLGGPLWILVIVFAAAKVFGASSMSWIWVFAPVWIPAGATFAVLAVMLAVLGVFALVAFALDQLDVLKAKRERDKL